jgi:glycerol-1-phosphate dehydrogenase [NAD(P)+]
MEITIPSLLRIKPNALYKIGKYLRNEKFNQIALFLGEGIKELFYKELLISFESSEIKVRYEQVVTGNSVEESFKQGTTLPSGISAIVAIGGGKAIDFCKYLAFINQLPLVTVPTAISNDGFASPMASLTIDGKRKSFKTAIPYGVIVDTEIIRNSPAIFTYSGIGDLISKYTALYDWKLAFKKTGEPVNDFAAIISRSSVDTLFYYSPKNIQDHQFLGLIANSLLISGIAMEIARSSRPASGSEHLISHAYDKIAPNTSTHGIQVGVATYAVSFLQQITHETVKNAIVQTGFLDFVSTHKLKKSAFIESIKMANDIKENFYTILSERNSIEQLIQFIDNDDIIAKMME